MTIRHIRLIDLAEIIAGLVKQGVTFECRPDSPCQGTWQIELTGGF